MSNRVPYNTVTGRAFYNPATGRALYVDQHSISAFTGAITFEYGFPWGPPATMTCYTGPGSSTDFGFEYDEYFFIPTKTRLNNLNKLESCTLLYPTPNGAVYKYYVIEYLPSKNQIRFFYRLVIPCGAIVFGPVPPPTIREYLGYFGQSTPTDGIDGVYDTVISQRARCGGAQTTDQTFAFTISS